jgi:hypothetical protein
MQGEVSGGQAGEGDLLQGDAVGYADKVQPVVETR